MIVLSTAAQCVSGTVHTCTDFVSLVVMPFIIWAVSYRLQFLHGLVCLFSIPLPPPAAQRTVNNVIGFHLRVTPHVRNNASEGKLRTLVQWNEEFETEVSDPRLQKNLFGIVLVAHAVQG